MNLLRRMNHWVAHKLHWNWCSWWHEYDRRGVLLRWGYKCVGCGRVTVIRDYEKEASHG